MSLTGPRSGGTTVVPSMLSPQQVTVSSSWMAQACRVPCGASGSLGLPWKMTATSLAFSPGGGWGGLIPQQTTESSILTAQLKKEATAMVLAWRPAGGAFMVPGCPQQVTLWLVLRPQPLWAQNTWVLLIAGGWMRGSVGGEP